VLLVRLARQAMDGVLASDECFHAYAAEWIARHHAIPEIFPELYSGFFYYYPPLLHLLGAVWLSLFGQTGALLAVSPVLAAALLVFLATGAAGAVPRRAGLWAAALVAIQPTIFAMAGRFYVESLVTLLFTVGAALLLVARRRARWPTTVTLGVVCGLALLAKFNAWALWLGIVATAGWDARHGEPVRARHLAVAAVIALAFVAPWLVRNQVLFGSAWYPAFAAGLDRNLWELNARHFSTPPLLFLTAIPGIVGAWILVLVLAAFAAAALARRWTIRESVLAGALLSMVVTALVPFSQARHLGPTIAVLAMVAAGEVERALRAEPRIALGVGAALVVLLAIANVTLPNPRVAADPPEFLLEALPQVAKHTPPDARILSLWTYDTFWVTRRAATWPIPWGQQRPPLDLFYDRDPALLYAHLKENGITHVLSPPRITAGGFDGANYPEDFTRGLAVLTRAHRLRLEWRSDALILLSVVSPSDSAGVPRR